MQLEFEYMLDDFREAMRHPSPVHPGRGTMTGFLIVLAVINVAGLAVNWLLVRPGLPAGGSVGDWAPWLVMFAAIWVVTFLVLRRGGRSEWEATFGAGRRAAVQVLPDRLVTWDAAHRAEYAWQSFAAFRETKNLIVLYPLDTSVRYVPKRAVPDPAQLEWLRGFLRHAIGRAL